MSIRTNKRIGIACIAALLIVALAITLSLLLTAPIDAKAADDFLHATYGGNQGRLDVGAGSTVDGNGNYHRTEDEERQYLINTYGAHANDIYKIDTSEKLFNFLNGGVSGFQYGYLTKDMSIAYGNGADASGIYEYKNSNISSNSVFNKVLDGNGYTVNLWSQTGQANYIDQSDGYFSVGNITYRVAGLLCAVNQGTISNLTIDFYSNHGQVNAITGWVYQNIFSGWYNSGLDNNWTQCIWTPKSNNSTIFGIVCGENGANGRIDNVRVNVNNNLTVIDRQSTSGGALKSNMIFVGGVAGRALVDSVINNCHVNLADNIVLNGTAEGDDGSSGTAKGSLAVVGGILGKIDQTTSDGNTVHAAVVQYCAISGTGMVKALANKAQGNNDYYRAYSGGVVGACLNVTSDNGGIQDGGKESGTPHSVEPGQIKSIISDWTGLSQNNYSNVESTITGQLFGSIGSNVQNCVVLYDLLAVRAKNGYTNTTLDSFRSAVLTTWVGAYPLTEDGEVIVRFNSDESSIYDIRMHAISDGYDEYSDETLLAVAMGTSRSKQYAMTNGTEGKFIWESNSGSSERLNLRISNPIVAEILTLSANVTDVVNYTWSFGTMTTLSFTNTNGTTNTRAYGGMDKTLNKPAVSAKLGGITLNYTDDDWTILRNGVATSADMSGTALPGTYTMNVKAAVNTYIDYGYYDATQRVAAWQPDPYKYVITEGVLQYGAQTTPATNDWVKEYKFELTMPSDDPNVSNFEFIRMVRNGTVVMKDYDSLGSNDVTITVNDTTGPNGMTYSFRAYVMDGDNAIIVAETDSTQDRLVKIDNEAPVVDNVKYFTIDSDGNVIQQISEGRLGEWRKERILVTYTVTDNKSGIKFADSTNGITNVPIADGYSVSVIISNSSARTVEYTDNSNNYVGFVVQANVDYMTSEPRLAFVNQVYTTNANDYATKGPIITFKPTIGTSNWYLEYSWQKDGFGNDIWETAYLQKTQNNDTYDTEDEYLLTRNIEQTFTVNWNMGDSLLRTPNDFKLRMVNESGLYDPVYLSKYDSNQGKYVVTDNGYVYSYIINFKVARIYVDATLESVLVTGGNYNKASLAEIIAGGDAEELQAIFGKTYDGTTDYVNSDYTFEVNIKYEPDKIGDGEQDIYLDNADFADKTGVGVLYSPAYIKRPADVVATLKINVAYREPNAGTAQIYFAFDLGDLSDLYDVYFADHGPINFNDEYSIINGESEWDITTSAVIEKLVAEIDMSDYVNEEYYYGEKLSPTIQGSVSPNEREVFFDIIVDSELLNVCNANNEYEVRGSVQENKENIEITVIETTVKVAPLPVNISYYMDGSDDVPTSVNAGTKHVFTADYIDIYGNTQKADVEYRILYDDGRFKETVDDDGISAKNKYKIVLSISDPNYVSANEGPNDGRNEAGKYQFFFNITQGVLNLACLDDVVEYTGSGIAYNAGIPEVDPSIFSERDQLSYKYYRYTESNKWEVVGGVIVTANKTGNAVEISTKLPIEIGFYRVEITLKGNDSFLSNNYEGYMAITKASTTINGESVYHSYTGKPFTLTLEDAKAYVTTNAIDDPSANVIWDALKGGDPSLVTIEYYDFGWKTVSTTPGGGGWYTEQGSQSYKITYAGDEFYEKCEGTIVMYITPAEFEGIWFTGASGVYNGKNFIDEVTYYIPSLYRDDATVLYTYNNRRYSSLDAIPAITAVGEHTISVSVSMTNYATAAYTITLNITEAQFSGVELVPYAGAYDANAHTVRFNGLTESNGAYYYTIKDEKGNAIKDANGNDIQVKVTLKGSGSNLDGGLYATNAGVYTLNVTISADNFADLTLRDGLITIERVQWPVTSTWTNMPSKIPSGVSVSDYYGTYTNGSQETTTTLVYTNSDGVIVTPDANGILPDGKYVVTLYVGDNHYINKSWTLTVGRINTAELTPVSIAVLCSAIAVMAAAVVTAFVVVNKRKKADAIADVE